ncbi:hypothetical protein HanXRQr2_Chr02g0058221 [Helianthus annuus]|uniref:Uncharacterized protein n=1 Tax=Helianthus annuus TaxID=4232 RepID=A0A251VET3_HELAN|nr:hypothetical protein HanXRQr2_Chr02g0058221 [Helianthus annuus]KAJ0951241.1 hypothetical protein HanPSC8_Chr02g0057661 [Helianthus annuus]
MAVWVCHSALGNHLHSSRRRNTTRRTWWVVQSLLICTICGWWRLMVMGVQHSDGIDLLIGEYNTQILCT